MVLTQDMRFAAYRAVALQIEERIIPSQLLAELVSANPTQVRRDLGQAGMIGQRGGGYRRELLIQTMENELRRRWQPVLDRAADQQQLLELIVTTGAPADVLAAT